MFAEEKTEKGELVCAYDGELCCYSDLHKRKQEYNKCGAGSYILEFKFKEKWWGIDATKEDCSFGHLINHSKKFKNIKPILKVEEDKPVIVFVAVRKIEKDEEILNDYSDNSTGAKTNFPWLKN